MTYHNTVIHLLRACPSLFENCLHVDFHLFATAGTGFHWENGELVEGNNILPKIKTTMTMYVGLELDYIFDEFSVCRNLDKRILSDIYHQKKGDILRNICKIFDAEKYYDKYEKTENMYIPNLNEANFSNVFNMPKDVKSDWKDAVVYFVKWYLNNVSEDADKDLLSKLKLISNEGC